MTEPTGAQLLPFYLVIDVSASMESKGKIDSANKIMPKVVDAIAKDPILADKVRFGVIDFSDEARIQLPLCDVLDEGLTLPVLSTRGMTSYAAAFRTVRTEIESDVKQLKADGFRVHRPAVFFLSDGMPNGNDGWEAAFRELTEYNPQTKTGFAAFPNVVACGVDDADGRTLAKVVHPATGDKRMQMYLMDKGEDAADAISAIAEVLVSSVLASGHSAAQGGSGLMLPPKEDLPSGIGAYDPADFV